jgi:hypothetical protein
MATYNASKDVIKDIRASVVLAVDELLEDIKDDIKDLTPRRTGRAMRGWKYSPKYRLHYSGQIIGNNVPYITFLDQGSSRQNRKGIVQPAINKHINKRKKI